MEKELKNKFVRKLWNANTAIDIGYILTELEYEINLERENHIKNQIKQILNKMENTKEPIIVFIYAKSNEIKVLSLEDSKRNHEGLIKEGWKHTQTLDTCKFLEYIYNCVPEDEKLEEIKSLSN